MHIPEINQNQGLRLSKLGKQEELHKTKQNTTKKKNPLKIDQKKNLDTFIRIPDIKQNQGFSKLGKQQELPKSKQNTKEKLTFLQPGSGIQIEKPEFLEPGYGAEADKELLQR